MVVAVLTRTSGLFVGMVCLLVRVLTTTALYGVDEDLDIFACIVHAVSGEELACVTSMYVDQIYNSVVW
jgi:hypothetical protein